MTAGFAVVVDGEIDMTTVGPTARSARVNGMVTIFGVVPLATWSDEMIADRWQALRLRAEQRIDVRPVTVEVAK